MRNTLLLFAALGACAIPDQFQTSTDDDELPITQPYRAFADAFERERVALGIPGAAVAILRHGQLEFARGFGTKGIHSDEPVRARTLFRTASMGKVVTAAGVMSAVEDGLLDLDAPITASVPELALEAPETADLTLRLLLSHRGGLNDYIAIPAPVGDDALGDFVSDPAINDVLRFQSPPGAFWNYSNPNFYLAGRALENATGESYRAAIEHRVFGPLGMRRSMFLPDEVIADGDYTHGYGLLDFEGGTELEDIAPDAYDNGWARPAGLGFSNVLDWAKLMQFLMRGDRRVMSEPARREIVRPQTSTGTIYSDLAGTGLGLGDDYGLGVGIGSGFFMDRHGEPSQYYAIRHLSHGGDASGWATNFIVFPSTGFAMVVLSSRDILRPTASMRLVIERFGGLPRASAPPPGREVKPARFSSYAGTYVDPVLGAVSVAFDGQELTASGSLLDAIGLPYEPVLEPSSADNFYLWVTYLGERVPLEITFFPDASGTYTWLRSRIAVGRRATGPVAAAAAAGPIDPAAVRARLRSLLVAPITGG